MVLYRKIKLHEVPNLIQLASQYCYIHSKLIFQQLKSPYHLIPLVYFSYDINHQLIKKTKLIVYKLVNSRLRNMNLVERREMTKIDWKKTKKLNIESINSWTLIIASIDITFSRSQITLLIFFPIDQTHAKKFKKKLKNLQFFYQYKEYIYIRI